MLKRRANRNLTTTLLVTAAGVVLGLLWSARRQAAVVAAPAAEEAPVPVRVIPPRPFDDRAELTALPHTSSHRSTGADDYESIGLDELSTAFLARATESSSEAELDQLGGADADLDGFHIATIEDLVAPELSDDPSDFEIPSTRLS